MFERLRLLIGDDVDILRSKTVLLVGLGGVGGYAFESLVRCSIGTIIVCDNDRFDETNLNRQILSNLNNLGNFKVSEAVRRASLINNECKVISINEFITKDNIDVLFDRKPDFIIDAIDTISTKKLIIKNALDRDIKFISVMGTGNKMDASKVTITDIWKTSYDPVAKMIRQFLRKEGINKKVPVVFSPERPILTGAVGSNAFVPGVAGLMASSYAINTLLGGK